MAYVSVPKDLTKVKNKVAFNLTKRQLICIGIGAAMGIPCYFLFRNALGINNAAVLMVLMMLPAFLFAIIFYLKWMFLKRAKTLNLNFYDSFFFFS